MAPRPAPRAVTGAVLGAVLATLALLAGAARSQTPVAVELVLAVDTSLSVDDAEFALQMKGIAWAFRTPEIVELIGQRDGVAVTLFQWSGAVDPRFVLPWRLLREPDSVEDFAARVEHMGREPSRGFTAMGQAIDTAIALIEENAYAGRELKIDVSADGRNNTGPPPFAAWRRAEALDIAINGLPILIDTYNLDDYFREKVITGPGAFVEIAADYEAFARVFLRKLRRELSPLTSRAPTPAGSDRPSLAARAAPQVAVSKKPLER